jgi:predicted transcriptional regulator
MATTIKIAEELKNRVNHLTGQLRRSPHWIMREAIQQYVNREEARESFKQEALASWDAYKSNGRYLDGDEAREWLRTWGKPESSAPPKCHD